MKIRNDLAYSVLLLVVFVVVGLFLQIRSGALSASSLSSQEDSRMAANITRNFLYVTNGIDATVGEYGFNPSTGALTLLGTVSTAGTTPWAVEVKRNSTGFSKSAYVINQGNSTMQSFNIDLVSGLLSSIGTSPTNTTPAYMNWDPQRKFLLVPFFGSQNAGVYKINSTTNLATKTKTIATGVRPHAVTVDPSNTYAFITNWQDNTISEYLYDKVTGNMTPNGTISVPAGSNPRVITFSQSGDYAYLINEASPTIMVFSLDHLTGQLTNIQTIATGTIGADIKVHPTLPVLYAANRGTNDVTVYSMDVSTGLLTALPSVTTGTFPQSIAISLNGKYLVTANRQSSNLSVFSINQTTGTLTPKATVPAGNGPNFVVFAKTSSPI